MDFLSKSANSILLGGPGSGPRKGGAMSPSGMTASDHSARGSLHDRLAKSSDPAEAEEHASLAAKDHGQAAELHEDDGNAKGAKSSRMAAASSHQIAAKAAEKQGDTYSANRHMNEAMGHLRAGLR